MNRTITYALTLLVAATVGHAAEKKAAKKNKKSAPNPAFAKVEDVPGLPRVLLIGDSISITEDLYHHSLAGPKNIQLPANVHYTPQGYQYLAQHVAAAIEAQLPKKPAAPE